MSPPGFRGRASIQGLARDDRGQALALMGLFLALVGVTLVLGAMGVGMAYQSKAHLQSSADAAALAAARTAVPVVRLAVRYHERVCTTTGCSNFPTETVEIEGLARDLIPDGWVKEAGCDVLGDSKANSPGTWVVCEDFGAAEHEGWQIDYDEALAEAQFYLDENLGSVASNWVIESFQVRSDATVELRVRARLKGNPLESILRRPLEVRVEASSGPRGVPVQ